MCENAIAQAERKVAELPCEHEPKNDLRVQRAFGAVRVCMNVLMHAGIKRGPSPEDQGNDCGWDGQGAMFISNSRHRQTFVCQCLHRRCRPEI